MLEGIVECPFMRADGTICEAVGYDEATGMLRFDSGTTFLPVPDRPTQADAQAAWDRIRVILAEYPFPSDADRAVWLAGLLAPLARAAIDGPVPGVAVVGNRRGTGKGKLVDCIGMVVAGRHVPASFYPKESVEAAKVKLSLALAGTPLVHFDNLQGASTYGGSAFDSALTSRTVNDRVLGRSKMSGEIPWRACCYLSGNNLSPEGDADRRWLVIKIKTEDEHPEERHFQIEDLVGYVRERRAEFVRDALTILRGHFVANHEGDGRWKETPWPAPLGSFEAWDKVIRGAVWWVTGIDCYVTLKEMADESHDRLRQVALLEALKDYQEEEVVTKGTKAPRARFLAREIFKAVEQNDYQYPGLANVLGQFPSPSGGLLKVHDVGQIFRDLKDQVIDGKTLVHAGEEHRVKMWRVATVGANGSKEETEPSTNGEANGYRRELKASVMSEDGLKDLFGDLQEEPSED